ncbi:unnamed protein product [Clonostachys rosea f. rosea IK726]|uniref:Uncharacterized protein n=2 Tax=Clonostachys rosea f. rosea IK726 TaxID=1349383 RepID=A0ACA9UBL8_BIOOC|nr:unnamed protein product [Clonostachys rosea f. rosea IK726]CAG9950013.1 unnamed protein product [Clonostachys rosea f. rosea IK726]
MSNFKANLPSSFQSSTTRDTAIFQLHYIGPLVSKMALSSMVSATILCTALKQTSKRETLVQHLAMFANEPDPHPSVDAIERIWLKLR